VQHSEISRPRHTQRLHFYGRARSENGLVSLTNRVCSLHRAMRAGQYGVGLIQSNDRFQILAIESVLKGSMCVSGRSSMTQ
jgi:hypothetical protein